MNITAVIVLYNTPIESSETVKSILNADLDEINLTMIIWNNGPLVLDPEEIVKYQQILKQKIINFHVYEDVRNIALSKIYNFFIEKEKYDFFTVLDQDSKLNSDFFINIEKNGNFDMIIPEVYAAGWRTKEKSKCFPIYIHIGKLLDKKIFNLGEIDSISSGLTISHNLIQEIKKSKPYIFNIQYAFYGIDTTFFLDLKKNNYSKYKGICVGCMDHSLDFNLQDMSKISPSRKIEMEYVRILNKIYYDNKSSLSILFYLIRKFFRGEYNLSLFSKLVGCLLQKRHPRSKIEITDKI